MKVWKDKEGNKLTAKEFFKRWGDGIEGITPKQKLKTQLLGTRITLVGLFLGLCVSIYGWENLWWVGIVLMGAILNTGVQYLGLKQQLNMFNKMDKYKEASLDEILSGEELRLVDGEEKVGMSEFESKRLNEKEELN